MPESSPTTPAPVKSVAVVTDSAGLYQVASLPIGTYTVNVTAPGMQKMVANNVLLEVGRRSP